MPRILWIWTLRVVRFSRISWIVEPTIAIMHTINSTIIIHTNNVMIIMHTPDIMIAAHVMTIMSSTSIVSIPNARCFWSYSMPEEHQNVWILLRIITSNTQSWSKLTTCWSSASSWVNNYIFKGSPTDSEVGLFHLHFSFFEAA